jgi:CxxC motif-containing protein (DUF1111 family)
MNKLAFLLVLSALLKLGSALAAADGTVADNSREAYSQPLPGLSETQRQAFLRGRSLFHQSWVVAPAQDSGVDGLGPLYNRLACLSCHAKNGRGRAPDGPDERMQSMLVRLSLPGKNPHGGPLPHPAYGDQLNEEGIPGVPGEGRAAVHWQTSTVALADGEQVELRQPRLEFTDLAYGPLGGELLTSPRIGQPVYGLGLLEAVPTASLRRLARQTKADGVRGRLNRVWDAAAGKTVVGRFGWKANMPNLRQQIAGAMLGDLGIGSVLFAAQNCTAAQAACRAAPSGGEPELSRLQLEQITTYLSLLAVPARRDADQALVRHGEALFAKSGCALCHRPQLRTGRSVTPQLAGRSIAPYTDLLVHDMGAGLADGRPDFRASGREWRTPPLWGIGLAEKVGEQVGYLHDGRARDLLEAVLWHDGEAKVARQRFAALAKPEREALLAFLRSL